MRTLRRLFNPTIIEIISEVYMLVAFVLLLWYVSISLSDNSIEEPQPPYVGDTEYGYSAE